MNQNDRRSAMIFFSIVGGLLAVLVMVIVGMALTSSSGPLYSGAEQQFLTEMHQKTKFTNWPADGELVREGHAVCVILNSNGGNEDALTEQRLIGYGPDPMPGFMKDYQTSDQRFELVDIAEHHFCKQFTLYVGDTPI